MSGTDTTARGTRALPANFDSESGVSALHKVCVVSALYDAPDPAGGLHAAEAPKRRPNIVSVFADDLSHLALGSYGATNIPTSHHDALARAGVRFSDFCGCFGLHTFARGPDDRLLPAPVSLTRVLPRTRTRHGR